MRLSNRPEDAWILVFNGHPILRVLSTVFILFLGASLADAAWQTFQEQGWRGSVSISIQIVIAAYLVSLRRFSWGWAPTTGN
jgi:hypothetical protein